jgi:hypothetical protein
MVNGRPMTNDYASEGSHNTLSMLASGFNPRKHLVLLTPGIRI